MEVEVRAYGQLRDALDAKETTLDLEDGATVGDAVEALTDAHEGFDADLVRVAMVDGRHVEEADELSAGATLTLSPMHMQE